MLISQFPDFVIHEDKLNISCAVNYSGLLAPEFIWYPTPDTNLSVIIETDSSVTSTIQISAPAFPIAVPPYTCYVSFSGSVFPSAANQTSTLVDTAGESNFCLCFHFFSLRFFVTIFRTDLL